MTPGPDPAGQMGVELQGLPAGEIRVGFVPTAEGVQVVYTVRLPNGVICFTLAAQAAVQVADASRLAAAGLAGAGQG